jgi:drug/metabolite transporter (DMT)-like permease
MLQVLLGCLVFGEEASMLWWFGATMVFFGLMILCQSDKEHEE